MRNSRQACHNHAEGYSTSKEDTRYLGWAGLEKGITETKCEKQIKKSLESARELTRLWFWDYGWRRGASRYTCWPSVLADLLWFLLTCYFEDLIGFDTRSWQKEPFSVNIIFAVNQLSSSNLLPRYHQLFVSCSGELGYSLFSPR